MDGGIGRIGEEAMTNESERGAQTDDKK